MDIVTVEEAYAELLAAFGDLVVARTRGAPVRPEDGSTRALVRRYHARRRAFDAAIQSLVLADVDDEDRRALANMRGTLAWLDSEEPTSGVRPALGGDASPGERRARADLSRRYGAAAAVVQVGSQRLDRLTVLARLATEPGPAVRRDLFESLGSIWRTVDGDGADASPYRALLRSSAKRWARDGSPIEANARSLGLPAGSIESTLLEIMAAWRALYPPETGWGIVQPSSTPAAHASLTSSFEDDVSR